MGNRLDMLRKLGFTEYQSHVISTLIGKELSAQQLSKESKVPITKIYSVLQMLVNIGIVKGVDTRPKMYSALNLDSIIDFVISKKEKNLIELKNSKDMILNFLREDNESVIFDESEFLKEVRKLMTSAKEKIYINFDEYLLSKLKSDLNAIKNNGVEVVIGAIPK